MGKQSGAVRLAVGTSSMSLRENLRLSGRMSQPSGGGLLGALLSRAGVVAPVPAEQVSKPSKTVRRARKGGA